VSTRSVLLVGLCHASFDATNDLARLILIPGGDIGTSFLLPSGVFALAAVLLVIFTRGRLAYQPSAPQG
jgi:hypothetical protein